MLRLLCCLLTAGIAHATPPGGFTADISNGVALPIADGDYTNYTRSSYQFGARLGWDFHLTKLVGIGPEVGVDVSAVDTSSSTFGNAPSNFVRVRGLGGARLTLHVGIGYFFARILVGVDHTGGSFGTTLRVNLSSTGFAFVPELGFLMHIWRPLYAGITIGFPVGTNDYGAQYVGTIKSFTAVDIELLSTIAVHL